MKSPIKKITRKEFEEKLASQRETARVGLLPSFAQNDIGKQDKVGKFVSTFLEIDGVAGKLLNPSIQALFLLGYRPQFGGPVELEPQGQESLFVQDFFAKKFFLDLNTVKPLNKSSLQKFCDTVGWRGTGTLLDIGEVAEKYGLKMQGNFVYAAEILKIPEGFERESFNQAWLDDMFLGTELRILAWIYFQLFDAPYINPERRGGAEAPLRRS